MRPTDLGPQASTGGLGPARPGLRRRRAPVNPVGAVVNVNNRDGEAALRSPIGSTSDRARVAPSTDTNNRTTYRSDDPRLAKVNAVPWSRRARSPEPRGDLPGGRESSAPGPQWDEPFDVTTPGGEDR